MIEQIKRDREEGTPGRWVFDPSLLAVTRMGSCDDVCSLLTLDFYGLGEPHANGRRIARLPELEEAYIAVVEALEKIASASVVGFGPQAAGEALAQVKLIARAAVNQTKGATA